MTTHHFFLPGPFCFTVLMLYFLYEKEGITLSRKAVLLYLLLIIFVFCPSFIHVKLAVAPMLPKIKICCISSLEEARMAIGMGASAIGLVGAMPSGPGVITDELIAEIARNIPPPIASFLLTSETSVKGIIAHHKRTYTNTLQLVDTLSQGTYAELHDALPSIRIVQVIHVIDARSVEYAIEVSTKADALLLDSGNPNLQIKELGGTGRVHNWELSRKIVELSPVPVFLAGGINASNVKEALDKVHPFGIDLCSSVRSNGILDPFKLEDFFKAAGY
jgi:phosphoribosylanthranilate isomerase